jgi:aminoglycoside phosphotransferase (APT) family kinase protein
VVIVSTDPGAGEDGDSVREQDSFDVAAVATWLRKHAPGRTASPRVRQFLGGASNLTCLLHYGEREMILRRPPPGAKAASAHDMAREFRIQRALAPNTRRCQRWSLCPDSSVIGSDFYMTERVQGTILRARIPPELGLDAPAIRRLCLSATDRLIELHQVDPLRAGLADIGKGPGYVRRKVEGWSERYRAARTWNAPRFERVMRWLAERQPPNSSRSSGRPTRKD